MGFVSAAADDAFACVQLAYDAADLREHSSAGDLDLLLAVILVLVDDIHLDAFDLFQLLLCHALTSCQITQS